MGRFGRLLQALGLASLLTTAVGCQKLFGEFTIDPNAFTPAGVQTGPIFLAPAKGLYTTEWGGQATFTIVLDHQPTANVTVDLSSSNTNEGTVSPTSVMFTKDDWKAPQVVTVTGIDDTRVDGNQTYKIVTAPATSEDPSYNGKNAIDLELVNIDNETAGITVVPREGLVTSEVGGQDSFSVVLNSPPTKDVTISLLSDTPSEGFVTPASLIFTPKNWMAPQLATVTGVNDDVKDPAHEYKVTVSGTSEDQNYTRIAPTSVKVVNEDDDSAGLTVVLVTGIDPINPARLRTSEGGDTATFTVALSAPPATDVVVPVTSDSVGEGTVSPESLTFTRDNWNAPQFVTVTGVEDDGTADGDQPYVIALGPPTGEDPDYTALPEKDVFASNVDNEKAGFTLMLLSGIDPQDPTKLRTTEARTTATFSLALNSRPSGDVIIKVLSSMASEAVASPGQLIFTTENWKAPQVVSVTGVDDDIEDGSPLFYVTTTVLTTSDDRYKLDPPDVQVTNQDDDTANVLVVLGKGLDPKNPNQLVTEEIGTSATFTVALASRPAEEVTIPLTNSNEKEGTLWATSLLFTPLNYSAPQTVTIAGVDDKIFDGDQPYTITVGAAVSKDPNFNGKFLSQVQITNRDDDSAGVIVNPTSGLTTSEDAKTDSFTIRLQSQPIADVTIAISSNNSDEGKPSVSSVTFTPANWGANQTVTVTGVDDDGAQDGDQAYKIILEPAKSKDLSYDKWDPTDVSLKNIDNDSAGFKVTPTTGLVTSEGGGKATFTVSLKSKPVSAASSTSVRFTLSSSKPTEGSVSPSSLTFTDVNWRSPQTVTVTGLDDLVADGPQPYTIVMSLAVSADANYNAHKPDDVSVTNIDDDNAFVIITPVASQTSPAVTTEQMAGKSTFTVALNSLPTDDVTFTVSSLDTSEGKVSPTTLKFTPTNGRTAQVVTVTGVNDDLADGDQQYTVRLSNGSSNDPKYDGKFGVDLPFINLDEDVPGFTIVAATNLQTTENNAGTATFTVALRSQPTADVSIGLSSSNNGEGKVSPSTLLFTASNWSTPQTVTVTGVQDDVADGPQTYQVRLSNASSPGSMGDPNYNGKFGTQLDVLNVDDDVPGYTVTAASMLQTTESGGQATFSVVLRSKPAGTATVTLGLNSSNVKEGTVSPAALVFSAADWDQPHVATVTGFDDKKVDGNVPYQVGFTADSAYGPPAPPAVSLTNLDDDELGVLLTQVTPATSCSTTPGTTSTFTIRLKSQPSANVTIALSSDTPTVGTVSPEAVTFTPSGTGSWETPQTVTVTGVSDGSVSMVTPYTIITGNASAPGDAGYDGFSMVPDVSCTNTTPP